MKEGIYQHIKIPGLLVEFCSGTAIIIKNDQPEKDKYLSKVGGDYSQATDWPRDFKPYYDIKDYIEQL